MIVVVEVETDDPASFPDARWARLKVGGIEVFSELVYDTDKDGLRTSSQAERNFLLLLGERLRRALEQV